MKKIVIIGGGIAGLTAGIFAIKNNFEPIILEKNSIVGGECTGWDREGYHIDGCIHWLVGTKEGTPIRNLWDAVGALKSVEIYEPESFMSFDYKNHRVHFYRDLKRMEKSWLEISPADEEAIKEFCNDISKLHNFNFPVAKPMDLMNIFEKIKFMFSMKDIGPLMNKYGKLRLTELADKFKHPALRAAIGSFLPAGDYSAISVIFPLGTFTGGQSSIPMGGSKAMAMRMLEYYKSLGGIVETNCEVVSVDIDESKVLSVKGKNDQVYTGDYFVAALDAKELFSKLLEGEYNDKAFEKRFRNISDYPLASNIYIGISYKGEIKNLPRTLKFPVNDVNIHQNNKKLEYLQMTHYGYESDFAPEGHTAITVAINQFETELDWWEKLCENKSLYEKEKVRIGAEVIKAIENQIPSMKDQLKVLDVATPQTYVRYCNAYRGAFMGFWPTINGKEMQHIGNIKGLDNIFLSGQWLQPPGGLPTALITGKDTIMRLCKKEGRKFQQNLVVNK